MVPKTGNSSFFSLLFQGDLASNEIYYHHKYYNNIVRGCEKTVRSEDSNSAFRVHKHLKAVVFDSDLIMYFKKDRPSRLFLLFKELSEMYNEELKIQGINKKVSTSRFTERLVGSTPNLYSEALRCKT